MPGLRLPARVGDGKQDRNVLTDLVEQRSRNSGMEFRAASGPVHTLQLINKNGALHVIDCYRQGKGIGFALAGERTNHRESAGPVISHVGQHESRTALCLLAANLRVEVEENDIACLRNVGTYHSTDSLPTSGPRAISS